MGNEVYTINIIAYYFNLVGTWITTYVKFLYENFIEFAWVVQVAVVSITFSVFLILYILIRMMVRSWKRRKWNKVYKKLDERYGETIRHLLLPETNPNLDRAEIVEMFDIEGKSPNDLLKSFKEKMSFARLLYRSRIAPGVDVGRRNNTLVILNLFGTQHFLEELVNKGSMKYKAEALLILRTFKLPVNQWIANQLRNSKRFRLRRLANYASIMTSSSSDLEYFESEFFDEHCCIYDEIQLGYVLQRRLAMKRAIPNLAHLALVQKNPSTQAVFVRLMHQFNQREYCSELEELFNHDADKALMQEICRTWGYLQYTEGEESLRNVIVTQAEDNKVAIMHALVRLNTGKSLDIFVDNYKNSGSHYLKYEALRCMYNYGEAGMMKFLELQAKATPAEQKIFEFFKNPITRKEIKISRSARYTQENENIYSVS